jgi:hypothetical protein
MVVQFTFVLLFVPKHRLCRTPLKAAVANGPAADPFTGVNVSTNEREDELKSRFH